MFLVSEGEINGCVSGVSLQAHNPKAQVEEVKCGTGVTDQHTNSTSQCAGK